METQTELQLTDSAAPLVEPSTGTQETPKVETPNTQMIPLAQIFIDPAARTRPGGPQPQDVRERAAAMQAVGLLQAITVAPPYTQAGVDSGLPYQIVAGETRLEAARSLGWPTIKCDINDAMDLAEAGAKGLIENISRTDLPFYSRVTQLKAYMDRHKIKAPEMAQMIGMQTEAFYSQLRVLKYKWLTADQELIDALNAGRIGYSVLTTIDQLEAEDRDALVVRFKTEGLSGQEIVKVALEIRAKAQDAAQEKAEAEGNQSDAAQETEGVAAPTKPIKSRQLRMPQLLATLEGWLPTETADPESGELLPPMWDVKGTVGWAVGMLASGKASEKKVVAELEKCLQYVGAGNAAPGAKAKGGKKTKA